MSGSRIVLEAVEALVLGTKIEYETSKSDGDTGSAVQGIQGKQSQ